MADKELRDLAEEALALAKKHGVSDAVASVSRSRDVEMGFRDGKIEKLSDATTRGLGLEIYVDGRYGSVSTSDLRKSVLSAFVADAVAMVRAVARDPFRALPDPKLYEGRSTKNLELFDASAPSLTAEQRRTRLREVEEGARSAANSSAIVSVSSGFSDSFWNSVKLSTNGFDGEREGTSFWMGGTVTAKDPDGRKPEDWNWVGSRFVAGLPGPHNVGRAAAERALACIGSKKGKSEKLTMVVENRAASRVLGALLGPLGGRSLQQKQSFLENKLGATIASKKLTVTDDPLIVRGFGSRHFDGDGFAAKVMPVLEAGVLRNYFIGDYYGRKLKMKPTTGSTSNLVIGLGNKDLAALLRDAGDAILVTSFLGGNSNSTTGDYSFGVQGFRVRGGQRAEPVAEMNVSGNLLDLFARLTEVGSDPYPYSSTLCPSLVFEGVQFAGT